MKVILLQHIKGRGNKGDIIDVSDGFAQNSLIPQGLAKVATPQEVNNIKLAKKSTEIKKEKEKERILNALNLLNGKVLIIQEKTNEKGSLYRALGLKEINEALQNQFSLSLPDSVFEEKYALKETGEYTLKLNAYNKQFDLLINLQTK